MTPDTKHGKEFERELNAEFLHLDKLYPIRWTRILDTAGAGNIVRNADADFKLMVKSEYACRPYIFHIECKATIRDIRFENTFRSFIKPHQNAAMVMAMRAGAQGIYLFKSVPRNEFEIWDAKAVSRMYAVKRKPLICGPTFVCPMGELSNWAQMFCTQPDSILDGLRATRET